MTAACSAKQCAVCVSALEAVLTLNSTWCFPAAAGVEFAACPTLRGNSLPDAPAFTARRTKTVLHTCCFTAGSDQIAIQRAIEKYEDIDLQFAGSREGNLLRVHFRVLRVLEFGAVPVACRMPAWLAACR